MDFSLLVLAILELQLVPLSVQKLQLVFAARDSFVPLSTACSPQKPSFLQQSNRRPSEAGGRDGHGSRLALAHQLDLKYDSDWS